MVDLSQFIIRKVDMQVPTLESINDLKPENKPAVVFYGKEIVPQIRLFAQAYDKLPIYFI